MHLHLQASQTGSRYLMHGRVDGFAPGRSHPVASAGQPMPSKVNAVTAMSRVIDPIRLMQRVADQTLELVAGADGVAVGLSHGNEVTYICGAGRLRDAVGTTVALEGSLSGLVIRTGQLVRSD